MSQTKKKFYQPILCTYCDEYYPIGPGIRKHLVHAHGAIYKDYVRYNLNLFPNYRICYICNVNITKGVTCSKICDKQHRKIIFKGEKNSFFNKKHTKKTLQLISEQLGNYYADHPSNFSGKCHSLESRKKMSISALNNTYGAYKERDIKRQKEIQEALNCKFIRIKLE